MEMYNELQKELEVLNRFLTPQRVDGLDSLLEEIYSEISSIKEIQARVEKVRELIHELSI